MSLSAAVVIPARNSESTIGEVVSELRKDAPALDVLVVDDASTDGTAARAESAGARVLRLPERGGPARARNRGAAATEGEAIVFLDADCVPLPGLVARLLEPLERDATLAATKGAYVTSQRGLVARFVQLEYEERYARMARRREIDFIDTYACAYRREAFRSVGGFDERYDLPSTEDQELGFRLHERGARFVFVREALVRHTHAASLAAYFRKKCKIGYFKAATLRAHPGKAVDDAHTPLSVKAQLLLGPFALAGLVAILVVLGVEIAYGEGSRGLSWVPSALAGDLRASWVLLSCVFVLVFLLTTLPLVARAVARDAILAPFVPALCLVRAIGLGLGLGIGLARELALGGVLGTETGTAAGTGTETAAGTGTGTVAGTGTGTVAGTGTGTGTGAGAGTGTGTGSGAPHPNPPPASRGEGTGVAGIGAGSEVPTAAGGAP